MSFTETHFSARKMFLAMIFLYFPALSASIYFTVAVTIERYIAVCHPFKARSLLTYKRAVNVSFGIVIFAILYNAPRWWEYEILEVYDPVTKELTGYRPVPSKLRMHPLYDTYYCYVGYPVFMVSLPLLTLIILNILIYRAVSSQVCDGQLTDLMRCYKNLFH